jgi:tripartite-type tricarboxylate transporter receptor subunit TctC
MVLKTLAWVSIFLFGVTAPVYTSAQSYPSRPVRLIVPFAPGGSVDILARLVGQRLSESMGQQFVIDNRPGAGSILGVDLAAKAQPDGHTLILVSVAFAINASLRRTLPYDTVRDLVPVSLVAAAPNLLVVNPTLPAASVQDLVKLAKGTKGSLNYASAGVGTPTHLAAELFNSMTGAGLVHIPYKGGGPALVDVVSGQVKVMFPGIVSGIGHVKNNRLKGLGVTGKKRSDALPNVPTIAESGYPEYEALNWFAVLAPTGTPAHAVQAVNKRISDLLQLTDVVKFLQRNGAEPMSSTPQEAKQHISKEISKWREVVNTSKASAK